MMRPPRFPILLLRLIANRSIVDEIEGDLHEDYLDNIETRGLSKARRIYLWTALCSLRPYLLAHRRENRKPKYTDMVIYHFKMALRSFSKSKLYSAINIFGLAVGFAASLIIALFVIDHQSMDSFLTDTDQIYRLESRSEKEGKVSRQVSLHTSMAPLLANNLPEVGAYTRLSVGSSTVIIESPSGRKLIEEDFLFADPDFFKIFSFELLAGNKNTALTQPNGVILTASTASRYFGEENPLGQIIKLNKNKDNLMEVVGVVQDPGGNSSIQFDMLAPNTQLIPNVDKISFNGNFFLSLPTYLKLARGTDLTEFPEKVVASVKKHTDNARFTDVDYSLNSFEDIKSDLEIDDDLITPTDPRVIVMFTIIALLIIALAIVNYINLSTARALQRSHEVGIRKVAGARRGTLVWQFLTESLLTCFIALPIALLLLEASIPYFEHILSRELFFNYQSSPSFLIIMILSVVIIGAFAGIYPSLLLSRFRFSEIIKGQLVHSKRSAFVRKGLIVFQFAFSITLVVGAVIVQNQLDFIRNQTLSYDTEQIIIVDGSFGKFRENHKSIKAAMGNVPGVMQVSLSNAAPGDAYYSRSNNPKIPVPMTRYVVDEDFLSIFNIRLLRGKSFNDQSDSVKTEVMMNEALANALEIEDPLTVDHIRFHGRNPNQVVGIVENFYFESLHNDIKPVIFSSALALPSSLSKIILKVETAEFSSLVTQLKEVWHEFYPNDIFKYQFLDDRIQNMYTSEQRMAGIFQIFTILSILISCLGLFGLSTFIAEIKMKEISIRKVLGASVQQMYLLLNRQVYVQILIASIIAVPTAYYFAGEWLQDFAYKTEIAPVNIMLVILLVMVLAGITLAFKTLQAALANPANNLRNE